MTFVKGVVVNDVPVKEYADKILKLWALSQSKPKDFVVELNENADLISQSEKKRERALKSFSAHKLGAKLSTDLPQTYQIPEQDAEKHYVFVSDSSATSFSAAYHPSKDKDKRDLIFAGDHLSNIDYLVDQVAQINSVVLSWRDAQSAQLRYRYMNLDKPLEDIACELKVSYPTIRHIVMKAQGICAETMRKNRRQSVPGANGSH